METGRGTHQWIGWVIVRAGRKIWEVMGLPCGVTAMEMREVVGSRDTLQAELLLIG